MKPTLNSDPNKLRPTWTRRRFLQGMALAGAGAVGTTWGAVPKRRKRVALLATEVRLHSHAQHFIDRFLEGFGWEGRWHHPQVDLVSLYVDQHPEGDLSLDRSKRFNVPIYPTVEEALTCGGAKLAVDGVVIIGEHGKYAKSEMGQTLYPRHKWFKQVVRVFESSGRAVPVFNDKHLSTRWDECAEMVADAKRLGFPFLAGSSLPVTWRIPSIDMPLGSELRHSFGLCYGGVDSYDFHGLETAQCMSERRRGGERGIRSVIALRGEKLWSRMEQSETEKRLFFAALMRSCTVRPPGGYTVAEPAIDWIRQVSPAAIGYFIEHADGFKTTMLMCNGLVQDFTYAGLLASDKVLSCQMQLPMPTQITTTADFFNPLVHHIEDMVLRNRAAYPVERTLLTSGMTLAAVESLHRGEVAIATPQMDVRYRAPRESNYWRA